MKSPIFEAHGRSSIRSEGSIIVTEVEGPWNIESMLLWGQQFETFAMDLCKTGPIGSVAQFHNSILTSPDSFQLLRKMAAFSIKHRRLVVTVFVIAPHVEGHLLAKSIFGPVHDGLIPFHIFDSMDKGISFARDFLAKTTPTGS